MKKTRTVLMALASIGLVTLQSQSLSADTIVRWGGEYVSTSQSFEGLNSYFAGGVDSDGDAANDDAIGGRLFNLTTPMNPTSGYSGISDTFYGGMITAHQDDITSAVFDEGGIQNQGPNDEFHVHMSHGAHFHDVHMATLWQQADFLNGGKEIYFGAGSSIELNIGPGPTESLVDAEVRMMLRDSSGDFWLSQEFLLSPTNNDVFTMNSFTSTSDGFWAAYDPLAAFPGTSDAGSDLRFNQSAASFVDKKFSAITGVGFYFEQDTFHNNLDFHIRSFEVDAFSVPEPGLLGLWAAFSVVMVMFVRPLRD